MSRRNAPLQPPSALADTLSLLVVTERPPLASFFSSLAVSAERVDVAAEPARAAAAGKDAAVVDFGLDGAAAMEVVHALRDGEAHLPIAAVVCCAQSVTPQGVRALAAAGIGSVLDLQVGPEEAARVMRAVARGAAVLHLSFGGRTRATLHDVVAGHRLRRDDDVRLLELVTHGLPDHEIGRRLHLSPHTVKKRVEQLRAEVGARNRIELAAWAGRQGLYADATRTA